MASVPQTSSAPRGRTFIRRMDGEQPRARLGGAARPRPAAARDAPQAGAVVIRRVRALPHGIRPPDHRQGSGCAAVLILEENPGMRGPVVHHPGASTPACSSSCPARIAPSHRTHPGRRCASSWEGSGAYTAVDGERDHHAPGDFIITPSWTWHDHGHPDGKKAGCVARTGSTSRSCAPSPRSSNENYPEECSR
jgi:hypothetical protein